MLKKTELSNAFATAIAATRDELSKGMSCRDGSSAEANLQHLEQELRAEQARALVTGAVDKKWFQQTLRWLVDWVPESELTLIAALGRIARVKPSSPA
jgi:hypothetical protein